MDLDVYVDDAFRSLPFRIGRCLEYWDTHGFAAQLVGILVKERIGINIEYVHVADGYSSFLALNNCEDWLQGTCVAIVRTTDAAITAHTHSKKLYPDAAPDIMWVPELDAPTCCTRERMSGTAIVWLGRDTRSFKDTGFISIDGIWVYPTTLEKAWNDEKLSLDNYKAFSESSVTKYFSTIQDVIDSGSVVHEEPACTSSNIYFETSMQKLRLLNYSCVDGWWLTPACSSRGANWTTECIPILDDSWNYYKTLPYAMLAKYDVPAALVHLGYDLFWEFVYYEYVNALIFWWLPDSQFTANNLVRIQFPDEEDLGQIYMQPNYGWGPVLDANEQLAHLLTNIQIDTKQTFALMAKVSQAQIDGYWSGLDGGHQLYQKLACDFLREHRNLWEKEWFPDPRSCSSGQYFHQSKQVCHPCPSGSFAERNVLDGIPYCKLCPPGSVALNGAVKCTFCVQGTFSNLAGQSSCAQCARGTYGGGTGASECTDCGLHLSGSSSAEASQHAEACLCPKGSYADASAGACTDCGFLQTTENDGSSSSNQCQLSHAFYVVLVVGLSVVLLLVIICGACVGLRAVVRRHQEERRRDKICSCIEPFTNLAFPVMLMNAIDFKNLGELVSFENGLRRHLLHNLSDEDQVQSFKERGNVIIFISHQWLGFTEPDPTSTHYNHIVVAVDKIEKQMGLDLKRCFLWVDYHSVPQENRQLQAMAVKTLPFFASMSSLFIIIAPETRHADTDLVCNFETYEKRLWCRAEIFSFFCSRGVEDMYRMEEINGDIQLSSIDEQEIDTTFFVFEGDCSCCARNHVGMSTCDKEILRDVFVGLYANVLCQEDTKSSEHHQGVRLKLVKQRDRFFPRFFETAFEKSATPKARVSWLSMVANASFRSNAKTITVKKDLFGNLIQSVENMAEERHPGMSMLRRRTCLVRSFTSSFSPGHLMRSFTSECMQRKETCSDQGASVDHVESTVEIINMGNVATTDSVCVDSSGGPRTECRVENSIVDHDVVANLKASRVLMMI